MYRLGNEQYSFETFIIFFLKYFSNGSLEQTMVLYRTMNTQRTICMINGSLEQMDGSLHGEIVPQIGGECGVDGSIQH